MWKPDTLSGRVALVTGASRGIGRGIAEALVAAGAEVYFGNRQEGALDEACAALTAAGGGIARPLCFDVTDAASVKGAFSAIQKAHGRLDILVNNAGIMKNAVIEMTSVDLMDETLTTNMRGVMLCAQYGTRLMARAGGGSIINLASIMGRFGNGGQSVYSASKAGVIGFTLALSKEVAARQIRVNAIAPGAIATDLIADLSPEKTEALVADIGMGRLGTPDDIAPLVVFLASDSARYITGQVIGVDGGMVV